MMKRSIPSLPALLYICVLLAAPSVLRADWTAVRSLVQQGDALSDEKKQEEIYRKAYEMAQVSAAANPRVSNEFLWLAASAGRLAQVSSTGERIRLAKVIKENAEKAIALDNTNGSAYMVLGAWHFYVADLSWVQKSAAKAFYGTLPSASYQEAVTYLTKALKYNAENPVEISYIRGLAYEELDQDAAAIAAFKDCINGRARNEKERRLQQKARKRLD